MIKPFGQIHLRLFELPDWDNLPSCGGRAILLSSCRKLVLKRWMIQGAVLTIHDGDHLLGATYCRLRKKEVDNKAVIGWDFNKNSPTFLVNEGVLETTSFRVVLDMEFCSVRSIFL